MKIYTDPDGNTYSELPKIWNNCSPITEQFLLDNHWTIEIVDDEEQQFTTNICSKYQFINAIKKYDQETGADPSLYNTLIALYTNSPVFQFYWNSVLQLDRNNEDFQLLFQQAGLPISVLNRLFELVE